MLPLQGVWNSLGNGYVTILKLGYCTLKMSPVVVIFTDKISGVSKSRCQLIINMFFSVDMGQLGQEAVQSCKWSISANRSTSGSHRLFSGCFLMVAGASRHCCKVKVTVEQMRSVSSSLLIKLALLPWACCAPGVWGFTSCPMTQTGRLGCPTSSSCAWTHRFFWGVPWYTYVTCLEKTCSDSAPLVFLQSWHSACDGESGTFFAVLCFCVSVYTFACRECVWERDWKTLTLCVSQTSLVKMPLVI